VLKEKMHDEMKNLKKEDRDQIKTVFDVDKFDYDDFIDRIKAQEIEDQYYEL
jgi:hypothetical protein